MFLFKNNFGLSRATDNRAFTIESKRDLEPGDKIDVFFFITFANPLIVPRISTVHFNGNRVCPENISIGNRNCIGFDTTSTTNGRWDGVLSVYPKFAQTGLKITIELDGEAFVLGNDFGEARTWNSKKFIITSRRSVKKEERIKINFFVKYSELEQIPDLISISIDDQVYCVKNSSTVMAPMLTPKPATGTLPIVVPIKPNGLDISLSELPISRYPAIEQIPKEVDNVSCNNAFCGF